jgi:hypothetical protein
MAVPSSPLPVCRFAALLAGNEEQLGVARAELTQWYGKIDDLSEVVPFGVSALYEEEMGTGLVRQWVRFEPLFSPEHLTKCKLETNMAETLLARQFSERAAGGKSRRPINIDPGYVGREKVVVATTKDAGHRVYMREGIYAEVILQRGEQRWAALPWTEPDYQLAQAIAFFERARAAYVAQLQQMAGAH